MLDHGLVCKLNERLGVREGMQSRVSTAIASGAAGLAGERRRRHTRGLRRVPNPPTRMMATMAVRCMRLDTNWMRIPFILAVVV